MKTISKTQEAINEFHKRFGYNQELRDKIKKDTNPPLSEEQRELLRIEVDMMMAELKDHVGEIRDRRKYINLV